MKKRIKKGLSKNHFHVTVFGSSRIKRNDKEYKLIFQLGKLLGERGIDVVTGGGPGIMEAASRGHKSGDPKNLSHSIGLGIKLPHEQGFNESIELYKEFNKFSARLDNFMLYSNAIVVAHGGVGTLLELFYTWQLIQVKHTCNIPVILLGDMWTGLITWLKKEPMKRGYFNKDELNLIYHAKNCNEAIEIIENSFEHFKRGEDNFCLNKNKYKIR